MSLVNSFVLFVFFVLFVVSRTVVGLNGYGISGFGFGVSCYDALVTVRNTTALQGGEHGIFCRGTEPGLADA